MQHVTTVPVNQGFGSRERSGSHPNERSPSDSSLFRPRPWRSIVTSALATSSQATPPGTNGRIAFMRPSPMAAPLNRNLSSDILSLS